MVKPNAVLDAAAGEVAPRLLDRHLVEVHPLHRNLRIGARDGHARPATAAGDVGDAGGRIRREPLVQLWQRRKPLAAEQLLEHRTREPRLPEVTVVAVPLEGDPLAGAEGFDELVDWASARHCELGER